MVHIHTSHANMAINPNDFTESVRVTVLHLERIHARSEKSVQMGPLLSLASQRY